MMAGGVLLYGGVGVVNMFMGGKFLDYGVLKPDPAAAQHVGILLIEAGVGITVAGVMISLVLQLRRQEDAVSTFLGLYNYWIVIGLMMSGLFIVIARRNLVKKVVGLNIFQTSVFLLLHQFRQGPKAARRTDPGRPLHPLLQPAARTSSS